MRKKQLGVKCVYYIPFIQETKELQICKNVFEIAIRRKTLNYKNDYLWGARECTEGLGITSLDKPGVVEFSLEPHILCVITQTNLESDS